MSIKIKVEGGTRADRHLCLTCSHSQVMRGSVDSQEVTICRDNDGDETGVAIRVPFKISTCNRFAERSETAPAKLRQDAYYLFRLPHSGYIVGLTGSQFEDYHFMNELREEDEKRFGNKAKDIISGIMQAASKARRVGK